MVGEPVVADTIGIPVPASPDIRLDLVKLPRELLAIEVTAISRYALY
jgi:hypothetical protein